jgi:hypothetical protein
MEPCKPVWRRLGWLLILWAASVAALGVFAWLLRGVMSLVGMTA